MDVYQFNKEASDNTMSDTQMLLLSIIDIIKTFKLIPPAAARKREGSLKRNRKGDFVEGSTKRVTRKRHRFEFKKPALQRNLLNFALCNSQFRNSRSPRPSRSAFLSYLPECLYWFR